MIKNIAIHHTGGLGNDNSASTKHLTVKNIDSAHKARWPHFKSSMGYYVGYNIVIHYDGTWTQTRKLGEETAAVIGHNDDTFHICLAGNFNKDVDKPSFAQINILGMLLFTLLHGNLKEFDIKVVDGVKYELSEERVYPHRVLHPNHTDCYGTSLSDLWIKTIVKDAIMKYMTLPEPCVALKEYINTPSEGFIGQIVGFIKRLIIKDMESEKKFGFLSSSEDPKKLGDTAKGLILGFGVLIIAAAHALGVNISNEELTAFAIDIGSVVSSLWFAYGLIKKIIVSASNRWQNRVK